MSTVLTCDVASSQFLGKAVLSGDVYPGITTVGCLVSMMDCTRLAGVKPYYREMSASESGCTKGWACGVAEKGGDWLGSFDWASYQGSMNGIRGPDVQQGLRSLMGKVTHLCRVYEL